MKLISNLKWKFLKIYQHIFYWLEWYFSDERKDPYRCTECGSTDVELKVWSKVNEGGRYGGDCDEFDHSFCNNCEENIHIRPTSYILVDVERWWDAAEIRTRAAVSGIAVAGFAPEDVREGFEYACDKFWERLTDEEKIDKWNDNK